MNSLSASTFSSTLYPALALMAGIGIPIMATLSSALGIKISSSTGAASVLFLGALLISSCALLITGLPSVKSLQAAPPLLYTGGALLVFYVFAITWLIPRFGISNAIFFVLLGQIISASLLNHIGAFNTQITPFTSTRLIGIGLMILGIFLTRRG